MITPRQAQERFGDPADVRNEREYMALYHPPKGTTLPARIYMNKCMIPYFDRAIREIIAEGKAHLIETWDGCFSVRKMRTSETKYSLHAWGLAFDINAKTNALGAVPQIATALVRIFERNGFDWGGNWKIRDGMHFQLSALPDDETEAKLSVDKK